MIKIYCLIDPRNNSVFYVGVSKTPLNKRLSAHIANAKWEGIKKRNNIDNFLFAQQKNLLILDLINSKSKPIIKELIEVNINETNHYEHYYYTQFTTEGFILLQDPNRFKYEQQNSKSVIG